MVVDGFCLVEDCDASVDLILHSAFVCTAVHSCFDGRAWVVVDVHGCMGRLTSPTSIKSFKQRCMLMTFKISQTLCPLNITEGGSVD